MLQWWPITFGVFTELIPLPQECGRRRWAHLFCVLFGQWLVGYVTATLSCILSKESLQVERRQGSSVNNSTIFLSHSRSVNGQRNKLDKLPCTYGCSARLLVLCSKRDMHGTCQCVNHHATLHAPTTAARRKLKIFECDVGNVLILEKWNSFFFFLFLFPRVRLPTKVE